MAKSRKQNPSLFDAPVSDSAVPPPPSGGAENVALHEAAQSR